MKIPCDKFAHLVGGYAVAITAGIIYDPLAGFVISCIVWAIKELVDAMGYGTPDRYDFIASALGAGAAYVVLVLRASLI